MTRYCTKPVTKSYCRNKDAHGRESQHTVMESDVSAERTLHALSADISIHTNVKTVNFGQTNLSVWSKWKVTFVSQGYKML